MSSAPAIRGVSEIVLSVADLPRMRTFYTDVMGFRLHGEYSMESATHDPDGEATITFLTITDVDTPLGRGGHPQMLVLIDHRRHVHARKRLVGHDVTRSTLNHLAFEIATEDRELESVGVVEEARQIRPGAKVVLMTTDWEEGESNGRMAGVTRVRKPFDLEEFRAVVDGLLEEVTETNGSAK